MAELLKVIDSRHELKCLHPVARNGIKKTEELVKLFSRTERNNRFVSALDVLVFFRFLDDILGNSYRITKCRVNNLIAKEAYGK